MDTSTIVWIVVIAIAVVALLAAIAVAASRKKKERNRAHAAELREQAAEQVSDVQRREALAKETEAKAAAARAEAERKAAEAERLEAEAQDRAQAADRHRQEHQEHLRKADELDPDVKHPAPTTDPEGHDIPTQARRAPADGAEPTSDAAQPHRSDTTEESHHSGGAHRA